MSFCHSQWLAADNRQYTPCNACRFCPDAESSHNELWDAHQAAKEESNAECACKTLVAISDIP